MMLAIVVLGGMGSQLGVAVAAHRHDRRRLRSCSASFDRNTAC